MNKDLEAYLQGPAPLPDASYTSLQRQALAELLHLSADVVDPIEAQIESEYQAARMKTQRQFDAEKGRIEENQRTQSETFRAERDARVEDTQAEYEGQLSAIKIETQHKRKKVNQGAVELEQKAEKERQEQIMVAEFVAEGAVTKYKQKRLEAKDAGDRARRHLASLGEEAQGLLRLYRQTSAAETGETKADDAGDQAANETYESCQGLVEQRLEALKNLRTAQLFVGARPILFAAAAIVVILILLGILYQLKIAGLPSGALVFPVAIGVGLVLVGVGGRLLWRKAKYQVREAHGEFQEALAQACAALERQSKAALEGIEREFRASAEQKEAELKQARNTLETAKANITKQRGMSLHEIELHRREALDHLRARRDTALREAEQAFEQQQAELDRQSQEELAQAQKQYNEEMAACEGEYQSARQHLEERWDKGLACIRSLLARKTALEDNTSPGWDHLPTAPASAIDTSDSFVRFGSLPLDVRPLAESVMARAGTPLSRESCPVLPALLELPDRCSIFLQSERDGRQRAIQTLRAVMVRLFTSLPPGRVRLTILDPVGLGESFAGFMHAGDYQDSLVGGRIWTETAQIQQQLEDLTQHMETVIQKYLRNEFDTIEEYNKQAGELAEPYRFLVIADFPANFNEEAARRLSSIVQSGPRCGVHTLIAHDLRQEMPPGIDINDISANSVHLLHKDGRYVWQDPVLERFPLTLDAPPAETTLTQIMHRVGKATAESARVEVPFAAVAPPEQEYWSSDSREELSVPLGRTGATRLQHLRLGRGVAQHMLIAGKTGSGKSTLLHVMVTNLALWYAPDQVELYLIDFKQGVEFKTYVTHDLPHARAVAIESDREFGLSILQRLDAEMTYRGDLFRQAGVQDIAAYRQSTGKSMPRTVLIVDEFQIFFSEDDKLAQDAAVLLEQLVRQGRAFGIHVVLGSQTLGGAFGLAHSTMGQMAVRIALQCSEADSQLILDEENVAARLLSRPGEAIYNDVGGQVAGNSPFQTAWLPDSTRDVYLSQIAVRNAERPPRAEPMIVFEGSVPADIRNNRELAACIKGQADGGEISAPRIWLGAPVIIKAPTAVIIRQQSGANVLMIGQRDEAAMNLTTAAIASLAAQLPPTSARFMILDGTPSDSPFAGALPRATAALPHECRMVSWHEVSDAIVELGREVNRRVQDGHQGAPTVFLLIYGLQRYRMLRRAEDAFGFSLDEEAGPRPDVQFANILREGPAVGVHVITWADTLGTLERTLDRQTVREFDHRVLFQMSATDSSNLIDAPTANQLGFHRALLYSEEQGGLEKFRPYAALHDDWLAGFGRELARRFGPSDKQS
jgi:hypothetical protein